MCFGLIVAIVFPNGNEQYRSYALNLCIWISICIYLWFRCNKHVAYAANGSWQELLNKGITKQVNTIV